MSDEGYKPTPGRRDQCRHCQGPITDETTWWIAGAPYCDDCLKMLWPRCEDDDVCYTLEEARQALGWHELTKASRAALCAVTDRLADLCPENVERTPARQRAQLQACKALLRGALTKADAMIADALAKAKDKRDRTVTWTECILVGDSFKADAAMNARLHAVWDLIEKTNDAPFRGYAAGKCRLMGYNVDTTIPGDSKWLLTFEAEKAKDGFMSLAGERGSFAALGLGGEAAERGEQ